MAEPDGLRSSYLTVQPGLGPARSHSGRRGSASHA